MIKNILIILLTVIIGILCLTKNNKKEIIKEVVEIPKIIKHTDTVIVEKVIRVPHIINNKEIIVDKEYKELFLKTKDSLKKLELFLKSIEIKNNKITINDDNLLIEGDITTRGTLIDYNFNYEIKERLFEYIPKTKREYPKLSLGLGAEIGINETIFIKGNLFLTNKKGNMLSLGYDNNKTIWVGLSKQFKLLK